MCNTSILKIDFFEKEQKRISRSLIFLQTINLHKLVVEEIVFTLILIKKVTTICFVLTLTEMTTLDNSDYCS